MVVKLHLFRGFENPRLRITSDTELGHLYEDTNSFAILAFAAEKIGLAQGYAQNSNGFIHFDLWGKPLERAKEIFQIVTDIELAKDMEVMKEIAGPKACPKCRGKLQPCEDGMKCFSCGLIIYEEMYHGGYETNHR